MALWLNKKISLLFVLALFCGTLSAQSVSGDNAVPTQHDPTDYKDPVQFERFGKRRSIIGAWQINQLKKGALVVRLKTNRMVIDALRKDNKNELADEKEREQYAINKNTMFAYRDFLKFCKVYFIYSHTSDSLLNGVRSGIFLDTNLAVDPSIKMDENFYMLAERDYAYNSSIGFVPEDSARTVQERGNPTKEMAIVIKNKYGHQVKAPFPYCVKEKTLMDAFYEMPISVNPIPGSSGTVIFFPINKTYLTDLKDPVKKAQLSRRIPNQMTVKVPVAFTYERIATAVDQLNDYLTQYYRANPNPDPTRIDESVKVFLY